MSDTSLIYSSPDAWLAAPRKRVLFYGMSGLGKTHLSTMLREIGDWFHYSIDYRIGTRYMGEFIADNAKAHAMQVPFLRDLLMTDSIYIGSNITFANLSPVSTYLGKPGDPDQGGLPIDEYRRRQEEFRRAELSALNDTGYFIDRAERLYGYSNFVCDTGGSICEWVDGDDLSDPLLNELASHCLLIWLQGSEAHKQELIRRFDKAPKPMCYQSSFLKDAWSRYINEFNVQPDKVHPDDFIRWTYAQALEHRAPRYQSMAKWGLTLTMDDLASIDSVDAFQTLVARAIETRI